VGHELTGVRSPPLERIEVLDLCPATSECLDGLLVLVVPPDRVDRPGEPPSPSQLVGEVAEADARGKERPQPFRRQLAGLFHDLAGEVGVKDSEHDFLHRQPVGRGRLGEAQVAGVHHRVDLGFFPQPVDDIEVAVRVADKE